MHGKGACSTRKGHFTECGQGFGVKNDTQTFDGKHLDYFILSSVIRDRAISVESVFPGLATIDGTVDAQPSFMFNNLTIYTMILSYKK